MDHNQRKDYIYKYYQVILLGYENGFNEGTVVHRNVYHTVT